jgi:uncharacterized protein YjbI with pentapeptide repeats
LANPEHLARLKEGVEPWNQWREQNPNIEPDLSKADLSGAFLYDANLFSANSRGADLDGARAKPNLSDTDLSGANLSGANLTGANLSGANLSRADLTGAELCEANLSIANLSWANLLGANLSRADLSDANIEEANLGAARLSYANVSAASLAWADLSDANLSGADLSGASLVGATLVGTNLEEANLTGCHIYGISVWDIKLDGAIQSNLVITPQGESPIQVDNLEVAQFIYLLLNNQKIRSVIDTITSKVVLILGRFTPERKVVLDAIRDELRKRDYLPVLFDFEKPASKDLTGTISTLANMARFVIADLTDPSSVPHELATLVPGTVVPVQTIILEGQREYAMFPDLKTRYHWVLEPHQYKSQEMLITQLRERVIVPAEAKAKELAWKTDAR